MDKILSPEYGESHAIVIGINKYQNVSPLAFACNDAEGVAATLIDKFGFSRSNVTTLLDSDATKSAIVDSFLDYANDGSSKDDRIFVFFAGHGFTQTGHRGEIGYLIPVDGSTNRLASLIRWDDLTRNCDLIPAKHVLFVMDACYGGLAVNRAPGPGSMRFLKNMLQRYSRQVLTAGKADEPVADAGGPIPNHSIFTGHFLQGLQGKAGTSDGVVTANGVMAYVYDKVANDVHSRQTPHFGYIDGDGDFIFSAPILDELDEKPETDQDVLVSIPADGPTLPKDKTIADVAKELISASKYRIKLHDLVVQEMRRVASRTTIEKFPVQGQVTPEELVRRLGRYEEITRDLQSLICCLAHWGDDEHMPVLRKAFSRMADQQEIAGGSVVWLNLRWYPLELMMYTAGIAAIASSNYQNLRCVLCEKVQSERRGETEPLAIQVNEAMLELGRVDAFKRLPGHDRNYTPRSEYLLKVLQPLLDDLLYLGRSYETLFDRFEVLLALIHADLQGGGWGPLGRFGWKHRSLRGGNSPFTMVVEEADSQQGNWPPLKAGLFGGSIDRFKSAATGIGDLLSQLPWF